MLFRSIAHPLEADSAAYRSIEEHSGARREVGYATLDQMVRYATDEQPDQALLLQLLEEDVMIEEMAASA